MNKPAMDLIWRLSGGVKIDVVDVGANPIEGDAPYKPLLDRGFARVTGFEPNADALAALNERKSAAETYFPYALGAGRTETLHMFRHSGFTSVFPADRVAAERLGFGRGMTQIETARIETRRLDDLSDVPPVDFLKIDVQGAETMIIANGRDKLARTMAVQTEIRLVPLYEGEPSFGDLDAELRGQGFRFHDFIFLKRVPLARAHKGQIRRRAYRQVVDGDAIYIRDPGGPDIDAEQLFRLALLAVGAFESYDLALYCLDLLAERGAVPDAEVDAFYLTIPEPLRLNKGRT